MHCKDTIPKIRNKYSQKSKCSSSVPISTSMFLWAIYIFPYSVYLFCCRKRCGAILGILYIKRSQTHECGYWDWGRAIPFLGIHKWDFRCNVLDTYVALSRGWSLIGRPPYRPRDSSLVTPGVQKVQKLNSLTFSLPGPLCTLTWKKTKYLQEYQAGKEAKVLLDAKNNIKSTNFCTL